MHMNIKPFTGSLANSLKEIGGFTAPATVSAVDFFGDMVDYIKGSLFGSSALGSSGFLFENLSKLSAPIPITVIIITASTNASDGLTSPCENELAINVPQRNKVPIKATNGLIDVDPRSSLKSSMNVIILMVLVKYKYIRQKKATISGCLKVWRWWESNPRVRKNE
jgi:hypothetical protein